MNGMCGHPSRCAHRTAQGCCRESALLRACETISDVILRCSPSSASLEGYCSALCFAAILRDARKGALLRMTVSCVSRTCIVASPHGILGAFRPFPVVAFAADLVVAHRGQDLSRGRQALRVDALVGVPQVGSHD